ncbi:MAG: translation initiation factor eIF-1A [Candidatus Bilamarchaeaceae archaeon]
MEEEGGEEETKLRLPRKNEVFGVVIAIVGGSRMRVSCKDGKERICRIPGKFKNKMWVKDGDVVLVEPWPIEGDSKGDIVYRYTPLQASALRQKGYI